MLYMFKTFYLYFLDTPRNKTILTRWKSFCDRSTVVLNLRKTALF